MMQNLQTFIKQRHMTQTALAAELGMTQEHVNRVMNGKVPLSGLFKQRFLDVYGIPAYSEVFGGGESAPCEERAA